MTPRETVEAALSGQTQDRIPFTIYAYKLPQCAVERQLRNDGLCLVFRDAPPVYKTLTPNVNITSLTYTENGQQFVRTQYDTPVGMLHAITEPAGFTSWCHKRLLTSQEDYKPLLFLINDMQFVPNYEAFEYAQSVEGGDLLFRSALGSEPMQTLISEYMGQKHSVWNGLIIPMGSWLCMKRWYANVDRSIRYVPSLHALCLITAGM